MKSIQKKMKNKIPENVDAYIASFDALQQEAMQQIRAIILQSAPDCEETISYAMPAYKYYGILIYFAAYKNHIGFYATPTGHAKFEKQLSKYKQGKGSVQFPLNEPMPLKLIEKIVIYRIKENLAKKK
jgi:uncharacterized protein YdhG (YjbR/CyaY superfamily)